jgi:hypothetical protein
MTEAQWQACTLPRHMLAFLGGKADPRKRRLFAAACCRRAWPYLGQSGSRRAVAVAERYADGLAGKEQLVAAKQEALQALAAVKASARVTVAEWRAAKAAVLAAYVGERALEASEWSVGAVMTAAALSGGAWDHEALVAARVRERRAQCDLLRDLFGDPFRPWGTRDFPAHVIGLARVCYDAFPEVSDQYLILADALAELGEEAAATHCRETMHAKGCHVLDALLGKA